MKSSRAVLHCIEMNWTILGVNDAQEKWSLELDHLNHQDVEYCDEIGQPHLTSCIITR